MMAGHEHARNTHTRGARRPLRGNAETHVLSEQAKICRRKLERCRNEERRTVSASLA